MRQGATLELIRDDQRDILTFGHFGSARLQVIDMSTGETLDDREVMLDPKALGELSRAMRDLESLPGEPDVIVTWGPGDQLFTRRAKLPRPVRRALEGIDAQIAWDAPIEAAFDDRGREELDWRVSVGMMLVIAVISAVVGGDGDNMYAIFLGIGAPFGALMLLITLLKRRQRG